MIRKYKTEVNRLRRIPKFPERLFQELGLWPLPQRASYWIWEDPRVVDYKGHPKLLTKQLEELDEREPARTMWTTAANEVERTKHVPDELHKKSIPLPKRTRNWIVPNHADNSTEDDGDEDADDDEESEEVDEEEEEGEKEESDE
ncbi:uncharacterized protein IUM83_16958 [Phytophthora cinnamomi]|uniref:uncharacterized protein n=1 Tax=Phytophthora cinnamomi TaxID=4785 RepID=UPI003559B044|nr:hypothetical protein IUM83_16958 [Phytophthora cinnamomi]